MTCPGREGQGGRGREIYNIYIYGMEWNILIGGRHMGGLRGVTDK